MFDIWKPDLFVDYKIYVVDGESYDDVASSALHIILRVLLDHLDTNIFLANILLSFARSYWRSCDGNGTNVYGEVSGVQEGCESHRICGEYEMSNLFYISTEVFDFSMRCCLMIMGGRKKLSHCIYCRRDQGSR